MIKLTVAIITYNEENNISRCISSVLTVADEVLVVDSFSTDKTEEICLALGARFIKHPFAGYIEQKNIALDLASHDYVLSLDADEALSPELLLEKRLSVSIRKILTPLGVSNILSVERLFRVKIVCAAAEGTCAANKLVSSCAEGA
jgi:glycosyltransferase involved in cell wall biosynthesis